MKSLSRRLFLIFGIALGWVCLTAPAADPPALPRRAEISRLQGDIKVDGELNEPVWAKAAVLQPFLKNQDASAESEHTEVRLWYDATNLYLGWRCLDNDIQATFTNRDSKFWEEEVLEFFVTPKELTRYFELQWNPLGGVFDAIIENDLDDKGVSKEFRGDWSFTAKNMKSAVKVHGVVNRPKGKDQWWQAEVVLPFSDLGLSAPKPGDVWRGNFYRFNRTQGLPVEELSWSPTRLPGFHQPSRFGYLEFGR